MDIDKIRYEASIDRKADDVSKDAHFVRYTAMACARIIWTVLPLMRVVARKCGYALAVHGSMVRDVDVVAVPWTKSAKSARALRDALLEMIVGGEFGPRGQEKHAAFEKKPHGRVATTVTLFSGGYIDLSVMPRKPRARRRK